MKWALQPLYLLNAASDVFAFERGLHIFCTVICVRKANLIFVSLNNFVTFSYCFAAALHFVRGSRHMSELLHLGKVWVKPPAQRCVNATRLGRQGGTDCSPEYLLHLNRINSSRRWMVYYDSWVTKKIKQLQQSIIWRRLSSEMWRYVVCYKFTNVSEERTASIFKISRANKQADSRR